MQKRMLAPAVALVALLSACTAQTPAPTHTPTPSATPIFATDAAALAAAEDAYAKYQAMEDTISHEGGKDPDRIRPFAARTSLEEALGAFATYDDQKLHTTGDVRFNNFELESFSASRTSGVGALVAAACIDVSATDLLDSDGTSLVPSDRVGRQTFRLTFDLSGPDLLLAARDKIGSKSLCG